MSACMSCTCFCWRKSRLCTLTLTFTIGRSLDIKIWRSTEDHICFAPLCPSRGSLSSWKFLHLGQDNSGMGHWLEDIQCDTRFGAKSGTHALIPQHA
ncbi:hypothetical protein NEOLEDRAFT_956907 [Neolentinus lepideus HHB14362 ss-1]|uniref:Uncharacterized protein n=1 Tax=Neolentinus lepideus HHB14362 ss-1 TaxID=1314782 RepID=A0A165UFL8_9AGAM|nr:hypothetical protein NEOLEDRAFT_956907 [Neolentinus lepideus HHB14362 ss-1]